MPLKPSLHTTIAKKLEEYEGRCNHLYLDSVGKVTVGIGHMIPSRVAMTTVMLYTIKGGRPASPASLPEKQKEYDMIAKQPRNYQASWYKQHTQLIMKDADIDAQLGRHIGVFYKELVALYSKSNGFLGFDNMPDEVQLALFDMVFNLGAAKLRAQYVLMNNAVKAEKWDVAARECNRVGIDTARNSYVKHLFLAAHHKSTVVVP